VPLRLVHNGVVEEILVPYPGGAPRKSVAVATRFRSTWLGSSVQALRERGLQDRYFAVLAPEFREVVRSSVAGVWLPIDVAVAHYDACDRLELPMREVVQIGFDVTKHIRNTTIQTMVRLASNAGATPWTILERAGVLWGRAFEGSGISVVKLGPKEARFEVAGWPVSRSMYCRTAFRGILTASTDMFCLKTYVKELPKLCTDMTLGYTIAWA
jgi:hypothetical protein